MKKYLKYVVLLGILWGSVTAEAQRSYRYRVRFTDKAQTEFSLERPQEFLSERALARRSRQDLKVDSTDLPVCSSYIQQLVNLGSRCVLTSKWNNTALMEVTDTLVADRFLEKPFVESVLRVWVKSEMVFPRDKERKRKVTNKMMKKTHHYGVSADQIRIHVGDSLHMAGFRGEGMHVAVIDAGFFNVDVIKLFKGVDILGTRDFVNPNSDIFEEHDHGLKVFSCLAANRPKVMVGTAPKASYWLLRSEDNDTEQLSEEDCWAAAIEFADSVGVDVVNTSLGYYEFDDPSGNYQYRDLNGKKAMISRSADMAGRKGILVVCSAGNAGSSAWKKISPPADAEHVLTVGAVSKQGINALFSSLGNTADGRVKPDVMAVGFLSAVAGDDGNTAFGNGTSFSSPIFCGLATCLWQACPWLKVDELIELIRKSSDRYEYPDNVFGYGVPNVWKAYQEGLKMKK